MKNDLENEVNEKKYKVIIPSLDGTHDRHNAGAAYHGATWPVGASGVKLQYKLAHVR